MFEIAAIVAKLLDKAIPDADAKNKAMAELLSMQTKGEIDSLLGQLEINKEEAKNPSVFVSGWRPFAGWICGIGLGYVALVEPLLRFVAMVGFHYTGAFPQIDTSLTMQVLLGMLGLGGMRAFEKSKGVASK